MEDNLSVIEFLTCKGLEPFDRDALGNTAMHYAVVGDRYELVNFFLREFQDRTPPRADLLHALFTAARADEVNIVELLQDRYQVDVCHVNTQGRTTLHQAAAGGAINVFKLLLDVGIDIDQADHFGSTPMIEACRHGQTDVVRRLLDAGASVSAANLAGRTALHYAAGYPELTTMLLSQTANIDSCDKRGWTPLHCAAAVGHLEAVKLLVENGAKITCSTLCSKTAMVLAVERGYPDVVKYLMEFTTSEDDLSLSSEQSTEGLAGYEEYLLNPTDVHFNSSWGVNISGTWLDSPIEVKVKKHSYSKNVVEELSRWSKLNHPHVVKLYGICYSDSISNPFFVYERPTHGFLLEYIADSRNEISRLELWRKLYEAALGLQYLHDRNLVHGDIRCGSIVITENGVAKLRNLGSDHCYRPAWTAPEVLSGFPRSFESDIYAFGIAIIQAVLCVWDPWNLDGVGLEDAILSGLLPDKPVDMTPEQWQLVERMCSYNLRSRLSAADVVRELELLSRDYSNFQIGYSPVEITTDSWATLGDVYIVESIVSRLLAKVNDLCQGSTETGLMKRDVYDRLLRIFYQLQSREDFPSVGIICRFCNILRYFYMLLNSTRAVGSAAHFTASRQGADNTFSVHGDLDVFMDNFNRFRSEKRHDWRDQWDCRRKLQQYEMLTKLNDLPGVLEGVDSEEKRGDILTYLRFELSKYPTNYASSTSTNVQRIRNFIAALGVTTNDWFIPAYKVEFDEFSRGAFGKVYHDKWKRSEVVVKKVELKDDEDQAAFLNEVEIWYKLFHPHVVHLFGACHIGQPFFVCEYAGRGQLDEYLRLHPEDLYEKLYEAALGLRYLRVKHVVHGDLKCNNILIGSDGRAKLTDFGLSTTASNEPEGTMGMLGPSDGNPLKCCVGRK